VIKTFKSKPLSDLWSTGKTAKIDARIRLDRLNSAGSADDLNLTGFDFHGLKGFTPKRFSIHVNGPWCITFEFSDGDAFNVHFEQYH
jgi:toxin HigB-1